MIWRYSPYLLPLLATSILCAAFVVVIWPLRRAPGARALGALLAVAGLWALGEFIQYGLQPFEPKLFMDTLAYVWVGLAPVLWLVFCLQYTRIRGHMRGSEIASLLIVPAIAAIWAFADPLEGAARTVSGTAETAGVLRIARTYGPVLWIMVIYLNLLMVAGTFLLLRIARRAVGPYRGQTTVLIASAATPWICNTAYHISSIMDRTLFPVDLTPMGIGIAAILLVIAVRNLALFDLAPAGRAAAIRAMRDGWLVIDHADRIVDLNPAAQGIFQRHGIVNAHVDVTGRRMSILLPALSPALRAQMPDETRAQPVTLGRGGSARQYRIQQGTIQDRYGEPAGTVLTLHDATEEIAARTQREQLVTDLQAALADVRQLSGLLPICAACKKIRDDQGYWTRLEEYVGEHSQATFTHGLCPDCARLLMEEADAFDAQREPQDETDFRRSLTEVTLPEPALHWGLGEHEASDSGPEVEDDPPATAADPGASAPR